MNQGQDSVSEITRVLGELSPDDPHSTDRLLPLVYEELRRIAAAQLAHERVGQTLQATALVHEAYLRLGHDSILWENRRHFFAAAAEAMRRILVERARRLKRVRHGGGLERVDIEIDDLPIETPPVDLLALDEALEQLAAEDPQKAELVKLRFFAGLGEQEAAEVLGISRPTASRYWAYARAWLFDRLRGGGSSENLLSG